MTKSTKQPGAADRVPEFRSGKASRRFLRNLVWVLVVGSLFLGGQGLRYYLNWVQLMDIRAETENLYRSVLGPDIGGSPFGRLQFEHGKLLASNRIGLDPLSVLAALSRSSGQDVRLDGLTLTGTSGRVRGFFSGEPSGFEAYFSRLSDDEHYLFSLYKSEETTGGVAFSLRVETQ